MVRKMMSKEVTKTTVKSAIMKVVNGEPQVETLADEIMIGNVSPEKAQKELNKKHKTSVTVFEVIPETTVYEMEVEEFIKHANVKEEQSELPLETETQTTA